MGAQRKKESRTGGCAALLLAPPGGGGDEICEVAVLFSALAQAASWTVAGTSTGSSAERRSITMGRIERAAL